MLKGIKPREYQSNIFETCKKRNCLVVLPTGLGKTLIALTNYFNDGCTKANLILVLKAMFNEAIQFQIEELFEQPELEQPFTYRIITTQTERVAAKYDDLVNILLLTRVARCHIQENFAASFYFIADDGSGNTSESEEINVFLEPEQIT